MAEEVTKVKKKRDKTWYAQIGLAQETYDELVKFKEKKEKEVGIPLSWNEYLILHMKELKESK